MFSLIVLVAFAGLVAATPVQQDGKSFESIIRSKREWFKCKPRPNCVRGKTTCSFSDTCNADCLKASTFNTPYVSGYCCTAGFNHCYCCSKPESKLPDSGLLVSRESKSGEAESGVYNAGNPIVIRSNEDD